MDTLGFASSTVLAVVGIMSVFTFAVYVVKKYAERNRVEIKTCHAIVLTIAEGEECQEPIQERQLYFLEYFEKYTSRWIMVIHYAASASSICFALSMMAGAAVGYSFNRSMWSYENRIIALLASIAMLGYAIYSYLKYRRLKKLTE